MFFRSCALISAFILVSQAGAEPGITRLEYGTVNNLIFVERAYVSDDGGVVAVMTDSISGPGGLFWKREGSDWGGAIGLPERATGLNKDGSKVLFRTGVWDVEGNSHSAPGEFGRYLGISADGEVVAGNISESNGTPTAAARINNETQVLFAHGFISWATAVNHDGSIIYFEVAAAPVRNHWWHKGDWSVLNAPSLGRILDCNRSGLIAVGDFDGGPIFPGRIDDGVLTQLPNDLNGRNTAFSVTESGVLIVGYSDGDTVNTPHDDIPLVWTNTDTLMTLEEFLVGEGMDLTGWVLNRATDMSPDGKYIVGGGQFNGVNSGFIIERDIGNACVADLTGDGNLDFFDVSAFLTAFAASDPVADFTGDGSFDFFDVSAFLTAFSAGCP